MTENEINLKIMKKIGNKIVGKNKVMIEKRHDLE